MSFTLTMKSTAPPPIPSYLLGVELLDHRLKSLLRPPTAPAEPTQAECEMLVQETSSTGGRTDEHTSVHTEHTGKQRGYSLIMSTCGRPQLKELSDWSTEGCR